MTLQSNADGIHDKKLTQTKDFVCIAFSSVTPVVHYANTDLNTKETVNVLPKQYNFVKIWMKPCVRRTKSCTNKYLYIIIKLDYLLL